MQMPDGPNRGTRPKHLAHALVTVFLATACILSALGYGQRFLDFSGGAALREKNLNYLESSTNKAVASFALMSVLKAGLDIIEGSEVGASLGLSASIEIGDFVRPAYDYVDIAWRTLLMGTVTLLGITYFLQATAMVDNWMLTATLVLGLILWIMAWAFPKAGRRMRVLRDLLRLSIVATLAMAYILPLSVWGAARLSEIITAPAVSQAEKGFAQTREELFPENEMTPEGLKAKVDMIRDKMITIARYLKEKSRDMIIWTVQIIAGYIFDCVVFPIVLFYLLLWCTRAILGYVFQAGFQRSLAEDLAKALGTRPEPQSHP